MAGNRRSSVSKQTTYEGIGEYWDTHDLSEITDHLTDVYFDVDPGTSVHYLAIENSISSKIGSIAKKEGISPETLVNLWLAECIHNQSLGR